MSHSILTYNGIDGACAAAVARIARPGAAIHVVSARRVADGLRTLAKGTPDEVHVCGVGVHCPWEELDEALRALAAKGATVYWHCGRGYLDDHLDWFAARCVPEFIDAGTNTAALARYFNLEDNGDVRRLSEIALHDPNLPATPETIGTETGDWVDFIEAAVSQYIKYTDQEPYRNAIEKLAIGILDPADRGLVETYRANGYRHLLHGATPAVRQLKARIKRCAEAERPVLITGESGVGKEHVANLIWERSKRAMGPLVAVNCALYASNAHLANSDLFGHVKGAFTGAVTDRPGKFAEADGGILFLDELGELPLEVQAKLLRVLEDGRVTPEGADKAARTVDVRIVAATNRDLPAAIEDGVFRADLFHRLTVLQIHVPPLRERLDDIPVIVQQRLDALAREGYRARIAKRDLNLLRDYPWPGNIRQLLKVLDRAVLLGMSFHDALEEERALGALGEYEQLSGNKLVPRSAAEVIPIAEVQRHYAEQAWKLHNHNYAATARALGVTQNTLRYSYLKAEQNCTKQ